MKYIVESILNYVKKENTSYAVLLNGKWGSGKTHFWENVLKEAIEDLKINGKNQKTIYVSLYGITSIDEINKRIVLDNLLKKSEKVQRVVESKWGGKLTELAKMSVGVVKSLEIPVLKQVLDTEVNYENLLDFTDTVLCFDDLERANLEITDILGYINNFVEHDGVKVIIISNEDEISEKLISRNLELKMLVSSLVSDKEGLFEQSRTLARGQKEKIPTNKIISDKMVSLFDKSNEYKRIKEKLIGKTLTLVPDYPSLIAEIVNEIPNENLKGFLQENLEVILITFKDSSTENIRILKQALDDFELIYENVQEKYSELGELVLPAILKFTLAASFEIKSGADGNKEIENVRTNDDFISSISLARMMEKHEKSYLEYFKEKYYSTNNLFNTFIFFKFAEVLIRKGIFHVEKFEEEMKTIVSKLVDSTPLHVRLIRDGFWEMSDDEFYEAEKVTYHKLVQGEVHFTLYFRAFVMFRFFIEKGLIIKDLKELKDELMAGLYVAAEKAEYYDNMGTLFIGSEIKQDDHELNEFKEKIIEINRRLKDNSQKEEVQLLMESMNSDFRKFLVDMQDRYFYVPVFSYYDVDELFKKILSLSNSHTLLFIQLLEKRYDSDIGVKVHSDLDNLRVLKDKIDEYVREKKIKPKISLLKELSGVVVKISEKLEKEIPKKADNVAVGVSQDEAMEEE